ncbi:MAG: DUF1428 domain-containing protein [Hyphomicrobiaceae bacterium]
MKYVDGYIVPVPTKNKVAYIAVAQKAAAVFKKHGATRVVEAWNDDVQHGKTTDFYMSVKSEEGESVVFSWIEWPSKDVRDAGMKKVMEDPAMKPDGAMPFDGKRLIYGGFSPILDV